MDYTKFPAGVSVQTTQDLTGGCTGKAAASCTLQDIEFTPSGDSHAWALSQQSGTVPFKVWNTTQANLNTGVTWSDVTANLNAAFTGGKTTVNTQATGITPLFDQNSAYITLSGFTAQTGIGHIYKTTNFGAGWTRADGAGGASPLPDVPVLRLLVDVTDLSDNTLIVATDIGLFTSGDAGATWQPFNLGVIPNVPVFDIEQNSLGDIFAGTHGRGAYQLVHSNATPTATLTATPTATVTPTPTPYATPTPFPTITPAPNPGDTNGDGVLGQPDYYHTGTYPPSQDTIPFPGEVAFDYSSDPIHVYVSDEPSSRVLGWNDINSFYTAAPADIVIGQVNFANSGCDDIGQFGATADSLCLSNGIPGIVVDGNGNLYVADGGNNRVTEYFTPFNQAKVADFSADVIFGQPNGTSSNCDSSGTISPNVLCQPAGLAVDAQNDLIVADQGNNRALVYLDPNNAFHGTGTPGQAGDTTADFVFGQGPAGDTFNTSNCGAPTGQVAESASTLCAPQGVAVDGIGNVWIADTFNNRILEFNTPVHSNGDPGSGDATADKVIGQGDFTSNQCPEFNAVPINADSICQPTDIAEDLDGNLYAVDGTGSGRVLEYNNPLAAGGGTPGTPGAAGDFTADRVYGTDGSFTVSPRCNGGMLAGDVAGLGPDSLCFPQGAAVGPHSEELAIADTGNGRVLLFDNPLAATATPTATPTGGATRTATPTPTSTAATPTATAATRTATPTPTATVSPTSTAATPTATPTSSDTGTIKVVPLKLTFSKVAIGVNASSSKAFKIENVSSTSKLAVTLESLKTNSAFSLGTQTPSFELDKKMSGSTSWFATITVQFTPQLVNNTETLTISSSDPGHPATTLGLSGGGIPGKLPKTLTVPNTPSGTQASDAVPLTNSGKGVISGNIPQLSAASPFQITDGTGHFSILPGNHVN